MGMSSTEIGLREARARLGDLVTAAMYGHTTIITRNGRPAARIAPLKETPMDTQLITDQVVTALGDHPQDFDVAAIVEEIGDTYGRDTVRSVDDVPSEEFWEIVRKHDRTAVIWSVVRGESPAARAVEPEPVGVDIPADVLTWAEGHGLSVEDPDVYVLVTPAGEAGEVAGEIAYRDGTVTADEMAAIREALDA